MRFHTRAVAPQAGRIEIAPVEQEVEVEVGRERVDPFADFDDAFGSLRRFGGADLFDSFFSRAADDHRDGAQQRRAARRAAAAAAGAGGLQRRGRPVRARLEHGAGAAQDR